MAKNDTRVNEILTGVTLSFPRVFPSTAKTRPDGSKRYDVQVLIPKDDKATVRKILAAIEEVGSAKWGKNWKQVNNPLRDGDKEAKKLSADGETTNGERYPERLGHFFFNATSGRVPAVVDRAKNVIEDPSEIYGGVIANVNVDFYPYSTDGNHGVGVGLNAIQRVRDGVPFSGTGGGSAAAAAAFADISEDDLDDEKPAKKKKDKGKKK